ncbi:hypothetical protein BDQ12DRAFT_590994, partial [Crucibulum laeve]
LRQYELNEEEREIVGQLTEVLKVCMIDCYTPNLPTVIPAMDHINNVLTNQSLNSTHFLPSIWAACSLSKKTLNCYYNKTDFSENYWIAMDMFHHPCFKLQYFKDCGWEKDRITAAEQMVHDKF